MGKYSYIDYGDWLALIERIELMARDEDGELCDDGFVAVAAGSKYLVVHQASSGVTFVVEYSRDHRPVQADAFERISSSNYNFHCEPNGIEPLSEEQKSIVATALKASLCDVKAFDPVTPAGKVAPVRLCPMGAKAKRYALHEAMELFNVLHGADAVYPLSFTEMDSSPVMALRAVAYDGSSIFGHGKTFRMRITACIPMAVHRVKDFNEMVHDVFGYKREDD